MHKLRAFLFFLLIMIIIKPLAIKGQTETIQTKIEKSIKALESQDKEIRKKSMGWLCSFAMQAYDDKEIIKLYKQSLKPFINALKDENPIMREDAVLIIGIAGDKKVMKEIALMRNDTNKYVQNAAELAMGMLGDNNAFKPLIEMLENKNEDEFYREYAAKALGRLKNPDATEPLLLALEDDGVGVKNAARESLVLVGLETLDPFMEEFSNKNYIIRANAAFIIKVLYSNVWKTKNTTLLKKLEITVEPLIRLLNDESQDVRYTAALALEYCWDERAIEPLVRARGDSSSDVRNQAWQSLMNFRFHDSTVNTLIDIMESDEKTMREFAFEVIETIDKPEAKKAVEKYKKNQTK